jgi:FkbM family methyltransferase
MNDRFEKKRVRMGVRLRRVVKSVYRFGGLKGVEVGCQLFMGKTASVRVPYLKHPFSLRSLKSDADVFEQVFLDEEYHMPITVEKPQFILDGGANIGLFAVLMKNRYPESTIVCVEPDPENFALLQKNVAPYDGIYCENCGLWDKDTQLRVFDKYGGGKLAIIVEEDQKNNDVRGGGNTLINSNLNEDKRGNPAVSLVPAMSIETLLKKYAVESPDIVKLDVETSEKQIFSSNYECWLSRVKVLIIELHDRMEIGCAQAFFGAVTRSIPHYKFSNKGENMIVENMDLH